MSVHYASYLLDAWRRQVFSGMQIVLDFIEQPWPTADGPADHQRIGAAAFQDSPGFFR